MELTYLGRLLRVARSVWRQDVPQDVIPDAREALKLLPLVGRFKSRDRIASDEEIQAIKQHWRSEVPPEILDFAVDSCMRLGAICRITWADLDRQIMLVRDRKHPQAKRGNHQRVPLLGRCLAILEGLGRKGERVFPYPPDTVGTAFRRARDAAGINDLRFHDLRHTGTTRLFKQGFRIEQVPVVTGHKDWAMLKRYTHIRAESILEEVAGLQAQPVAEPRPA